MTDEYFSDKELGLKELNSEEISINAWNGIVSIYKQFISNNALSGNFAEQCQDNQGICGCDVYLLENAAKAVIPDLEIPIREISKYQEEVLPDKYTVLDFLEFLYKNIKDPHKNSYHHHFNHSHYSFPDNGLQKKSEFRNAINQIFSRNGIVFYLDENGQIKRSIPKQMSGIITEIRFNTEDDRLNELFEQAYSKFVLPRKENRIEALEKIWDAFERLKTYFENNKKQSATTLISLVSKNNFLFQEIIENEFKSLTDMGNRFQIRHYEKDKIEIINELHIEYLFYRMSCLIQLCVESLKNESI